MKKLEEGFNKIIMKEMTFSVIYALLGLIIFLKSEMTNKTVGILIGIFFFIAGVMAIFTFLDKNKIRLFHFNSIFGVLSIALGIFIMLNPLSLLEFLNISLGIWIIVEAIHKFIYYLYMRKVKDKGNKIFFTSSLLMLFLGITIIINPFTTIVITKTVGIFILLYNIVNINDLVLLKRKAKIFLKEWK